MMKKNILVLFALLLTGCGETKSSSALTMVDEEGRHYDPSWLTKDNAFAMPTNSSLEEVPSDLKNQDVTSSTIRFKTDKMETDSGIPIKFMVGCGNLHRPRRDLVPYIQVCIREVLPSATEKTVFSAGSLPNLKQGNYNYTKLSFASKGQDYYIFNTVTDVYIDFTPWLNQDSSDKKFFLGRRLSFGDQYEKLTGTDGNYLWPYYYFSPYSVWQFTPSDDGKTISFSKIR